MKCIKLNIILFSLLILTGITYSQNFDSTYNIDTAFININNVKFILDNYGDIGNYFVGPHTDGGHFDGDVVFYSTGFFLSGKLESEIWSTGVFPSAFLNDYRPGYLFSDYMSPIHKVYKIYSTDPDFGEAWQEWIEAVNLGALYYDGDNDGKYDPKDKNGNGIWDLNEDRPDLIGDITVWCVYNDARLGSERRFQNMEPLGLEVHQTVFAFDRPDNIAIHNSFFLRYIIHNMGNASEELDSVYFAFAVDPDIASANNDLAACDPEYNRAFGYNHGTEYISGWGGFGDNPPAFLIDFLQRPAVYVAGESFIDNNENGEYDHGIDMPVDTVQLKRGPIMPSKYLPGAKNKELNAITTYTKGHPYFGDPKNEVQLRNYLYGARWSTGDTFSVRSFQYGNGDLLGDTADTISPYFMFSGDPVTNSGWLVQPNWGSDFRIVMSSGPFKFTSSQPIEVIAGFTAGRGTDYLNSITVAREYNMVIKELYEKNFDDDLIVGVKNEDNIYREKTTKLFQNYPNPFNAETVIKFNLAHESDVEIIVYNILGQKIAVLVNDKLPSGQHSVKLNAVNFTSGIYFVTLRAGSELQTIKISLLR